MVGMLTLISACSTQPYYGQYTTADRTNTGNSVYGLIAQEWKASAYAIPSKDRQRHERCVYFVLENANLGESCKWHGESGAVGEVKVVHQYVAGSKTCQVFLTSLWHKGRKKNIQDTGCWYPQLERWQFISKS